MRHGSNAINENKGHMADEVVYIGDLYKAQQHHTMAKQLIFRGGLHEHHHS